MNELKIVDEKQKTLLLESWMIEALTGIKNKHLRYFNLAEVARILIVMGLEYFGFSEGQYIKRQMKELKERNKNKHDGQSVYTTIQKEFGLDTRKEA